MKPYLRPLAAERSPLVRRESAATAKKRTETVGIASYDSTRFDRMICAGWHGLTSTDYRWDSGRAPLGDAIRPRVLARRAACTRVSFRYALNDNIGENTSYVVALEQVRERRHGNGLALAANRAGPVPPQKSGPGR